MTLSKMPLAPFLWTAPCARSTRALATWLGFPITEIVGKKFFDFVEEPTRDSVEAGLSRFLEKRHWAGTVRVRLKNNARPLYFDCVLNAIVKSGEVVGVSVLGRDVTGQHEKELRFTELFETLQEGAYFSTPEGRLLDANPALVSILGYATKDELLALDPSKLNVDPAEAPVLGRAADDRGGVRAREITLRKKDGTAAVFLESSRAVWDAAGKLIRYQGTLVDVTERRKLERQLLQQEEFRRHLLESFPDLILVVDLRGALHVCEFAGARPAGIPARGSVGQEDFRDRGSLAGTGGAVSRRGFGHPDFWSRRNMARGTAMEAGARCGPPPASSLTPNRKLGGVIVSVRDITTEKKLEQQIVQSERLAAMGAMIGGVAHELNNPLTSILGVSELLQDSQTTDAARKQIAHSAAAGAPRRRDCAQPDLFFEAAGAGENSASILGRSSNARSICTPTRCGKTTSPWTFCASPGCLMCKAIRTS